MFRVLLSLLLLAQGVSMPGQPIVFEGVHVVPMDREVVLEDMTVVVDAGRITALGRRGRVPIPPDSRRIDARGRFLLPGLSEMHVHLRERKNLGLYLAHGFTTVRDMNGRLGDSLAWRDEVLNGTLKGPRIVAAGVTLFEGAPADHPYSVTTPDHARRAVRDMAARGYDLIKVYRVRREPFLALMDEARRLSIPVAGHHPDVIHDHSYDAPLDVSMDDALASGMRSLEHLNELISAGLRMKLDPDAIAPLARRIRARDVAVTTLLGQDFVVQQIRREKQAYLTTERTREILALDGEPGLAAAREQIDRIDTALPRNIVDLGAAIPEFSLLMLRRFHEQGVDLLIGTDSHGPLLPAGRSGLDEMDLFVKAGLTPYDALRAATVTAARVLGRLDRLGTVVVGKEADLLLVDQNPLENLASLRRPRGVMVLGRYYDKSDLEARPRSVVEALAGGGTSLDGSGERRPRIGVGNAHRTQSLFWSRGDCCVVICVAGCHAPPGDRERANSIVRRLGHRVFLGPRWRAGDLPA
jgi:imidazolonepropionase-like amidohydrolase